MALCRNRCALRALVAVVALFVVGAFCSSVSASPLLQIQLGGVDIGYDGTNIFDDDPLASDPDPLTTVSFLVDGGMVGSVLTSDISLDMLIPDVTAIPDTGGTVQSAAGGIFNLSLPSGDYLNLQLDKATVMYVDGGVVQFAFAGSIASIQSQSLPYGLEVLDPVTVSFSTQLNPGSLTASGGTVDTFTAMGTGEVRGSLLVPEPASLALLGLAASLVGLIRRR